MIILICPPYYFQNPMAGILMTVKKDSVDEILSKITVPSEVIGEVQGDSLKIKDQFI